MSAIGQSFQRGMHPSRRCQKTDGQPVPELFTSLGVQLGQRWRHARSLRRLSYLRALSLRAQAFLKPAQKSEEEGKYLRVMLDDHPQFRLPPEKLLSALSYFRQRDVAEGEVLIAQVGRQEEHHFHPETVVKPMAE